MPYHPPRRFIVAVAADIVIIIITTTTTTTSMRRSIRSPGPRWPQGESGPFRGASPNPSPVRVHLSPPESSNRITLAMGTVAANC